MALFKCKMCGGALEINNNETVATCEYCGTQQTLPKLDDNRRANLYDRANHFRRNNEFDKAMGIYEQILNEDNTDAEAYWSIVLCRYGIEYVEDPSSHKRVPTVNRAQFTAIFDDDNYKSALQYADGYQRSIYEDEAKVINEIQKGILAISQKEEPFDVFICYKESDNNSRRTVDSVLAQDLYYQLTQEGLKVFFARITLEDKLGSAYEPYIFAALNSAKVMVVMGTKPEYFSAVWVKNEWSRYLSLIKNGAKKMLVPAYKDMDPYDLPEEFSHLQAQDMSKLGFMQDLIRGIKKIIQVDKPVTEVKVTAAQSNAGALVKRAAIFLEDGNMESANDYCEKTLDIDPECADAYVIKLLIDLGLNSREKLNMYAEPFDENVNYRKAVRFGDDVLRTELNGYLDNIRRRNEQMRIDGIYTSAVSQMATAKTENAFLQLAQQLETIANYQDAATLAEQCREKAEQCREKAEYARKDAILADGRACMNKLFETVSDFEAAIKEFKKIPGWKDADELIITCEKKIDELNAKAEADRLEQERLAEIARMKAKRIAKRNKKIAIITSAVVVVCITFVVLWHTVFSPMLQYNKGLTLFENGGYDEAIAIFTELEDYKDSADRVKEVKYSQASALSEKRDYAQAADIYKELGEYKDCAFLYPDAVLNYATTLVEDRDWSMATKQLECLAEYDTYAESIDALYARIIDACYADGEYGLIIPMLKEGKGYGEDSEQYREIIYNYAQKLMDEKYYSVAKVYFAKFSGYSDAEQKVNECDYQIGCYLLDKEKYRDAIEAFEHIENYRDSKEKLKEAKYQYVMDCNCGDGFFCYDYLKELKTIKYKDSEEIFKKRFAWKVDIVVNDDEEDGTTDMTSISKYSYWYVHVKLTGGEPDEQVQLKCTAYYPSGYIGTYQWEGKGVNGSIATCWFWYTNPVHGKQGDLKLKVFDGNGNLLGEKTVKITA